MTGGAAIGPALAAAADVLIRDYMAVKAHESVLITADTESDRRAVDAVMNAAKTAGAKPVVLIAPQLPFQGALADPYIAPTLAGAVAHADVWIDLTFPYIAGSHVYDEAMQAGRVRYLLGGDMGAAGLARLLGQVDLDRYYAVHQAFDEITGAAVGREVRITDALGTDVTFTLAKPGYAKPRRADRPGMVVVPGACTMFPEHESVKGVIRVGATFHEYYTPLADPISLEVDGRIRAIAGGGAERKVLDRALRRAGGGEFGYVIHFTHGVHPAARVTGTSFIEDMRVAGNDAVGLGIPWWLPGGGENHPDAIVFQQSLWVDGVQIADNGTLVNPPHLTKLADALTPLYN